MIVQYLQKVKSKNTSKKVKTNSFFVVVLSATDERSRVWDFCNFFNFRESKFLSSVMFRENIPKDDQRVPAEGPDKEAHRLGATEAQLVDLYSDDVLMSRENIPKDDQ